MQVGLSTMASKHNARRDSNHNLSEESVTRPSKVQKLRRPRLSLGQRKENHLTSEKKRRSTIRENFVKITELVPNLQGMARSEVTVLKKATDYGLQLIAERRRLLAQADMNAVMVDQKWRRMLRQET